MAVARLLRRRRTAPHGLTGRALILGVVAVFAVVLLASPLHRYLVARSQLAATRAETTHDAAELAELSAQRARWDDPAYVAEQARSRLQFARPGETVYVVIRPGEQDQGDTRSAPPATSTVVGDSWSSRLWSSVRAADDSS